MSQKTVYYCDKTGIEIPDKQELRLAIGNSFDGGGLSSDYFIGNFSYEALSYAVMEYFKPKTYEETLAFLKFLRS